jgi:ribulose-phosphate 3-epimerase
MKIRILPSLLAADMGNLAAEARRAQSAGGDELHLDIMDGVFVPNISMGPAVVAMARRAVSIPLNVHLMLLHPDQYVGAFAAAGATTIFIHIEADCDVPATLVSIRAAGIHPGITLNPETPADRILPVLGAVDEVLCMTVHPGHGGQSFMAGMLPKVAAVRRALDARGRGEVRVMVDGGINEATALQCAAAGADSFVAGTTIYQAADMREMVSRLRQTTTGAYMGG